MHEVSEFVWQVPDFLIDIQKVYYTTLAVIAIPVNLVTIVILARGKCGLSRCVSRYLVAMVVIVDLILRQIPIVYKEQFRFVLNIPLCNFHAVLIYATADCSVWFTVSFTIDRFVAICCQKLKNKYCTEKVAAVVLGTITALSCLKNIFWYFMFTGFYWLQNFPWFCDIVDEVMTSQVWATIEFLHYILTPGIPLGVILLLNVLTVRHILLASRARSRLRGHSRGESAKDPEMVSRRKSIILLFVISGNFIILWAIFMVNTMWWRVWFLGYLPRNPLRLVHEMGFMLQVLSCCTNTCIYAVTQSMFRQQLKNMLKHPFVLTAKFIKR